MSGYQRKEEQKWKIEIKEWLIGILIFLIAVFLVRGFMFNTFIVKGYSMEPNFHHGNVVVVNKLSYLFSAPEKGDIVVCVCNNGKREEDIIKRVIGLPGDVIDMESNSGEYVMYINGVEQEEEYIAEIMQQKGDIVYPYTVPEDYYFVMGDNRNASTDSRFQTIGSIPKKDVIGRVFIRVWPLQEFDLY